MDWTLRIKEVGATNISNMLGSIKWKNCSGIDQEWERPLEGR